MNKVFPFILMFVSEFTGLRTSALAPDTSAQTKGQRDARMDWWRQARFGMFIHWGVYSVPAGVWHGKNDNGAGEWIMNNMKIPVAEYQALPSQFNPTKFDADAWVSLAKAAGVKYIVITAKHHDGFAMFHSKANLFNIYDATPFKRDPLKELAKACQKYGLKLGFYYSQVQDWTAPGGVAYGGGHWDKAQDGSFVEYLKTKAIPQLQELLNNYQPYPSVIWFDTPSGDMTPQLASQIVSLLNMHPNIIWNNRLGGGYQGDTETPEQVIPAKGFPGRDWETCMTINDTWGFKSTDTNFKSVTELIHNLIDIASAGGNYLLNVGPTSKGEIPPEESERLLAMGKWLRVNGEAIYGTSAGPLRRKPAWGRVTQRPGKLYLSVFDWPASGEIVVPISNDITKAYFLAHPDITLPTTTTPGGVTIQLPGQAPDPNATVVVLVPKDKTHALEEPLMQAADGSITLKADDADIQGNGGLKIEGTPSNLGFWTDSGDYPSWKVLLTKPGKFQVFLDYALVGGAQPSILTLSQGNQNLSIVSASTGSWTNYKKLEAGTITVDQAGTVTFILKGQKGNGIAVANLRQVTLTPAP